MEKCNHRKKAIGYTLAVIISLASVLSEWWFLNHSYFRLLSVSNGYLVLFQAVLACVAYNFMSKFFGCSEEALALAYFGSGFAAEAWIFLKYISLYYLEGNSAHRYQLINYPLKTGIYCIALVLLILLCQFLYELSVWLISGRKDQEKREGSFILKAEDGKTSLMGKTSRVFLILLGICLALVAGYHASAEYIKEYRYYYRTWITFLADCLKWSGIPALAFAFVFSILYKIRKSSREMKEKLLSLSGMLGSSVIMALVMLVIGIFFISVRGDIFEIETVVGDHLMRGSANIMNHYYDTFNIFVKRRCLNDEQVIALILEEEYQEKFWVRWEEDVDFVSELAYYAYPVLTEESFSREYEWIGDVAIHVVKEVGNDYKEDYPLARSLWQIEKYAKENGIGRGIGVRRRRDFLIQEIQVFCTPEDYKECAEEVAGMISYVLQDPFFTTAGHGSRLTVVCGEEANSYNTVTLQFGKPNGSESISGHEMEEKHSWNKYTDVDAVYDELDRVFRDNIHTKEASRQEWEEGDEYTGNAENKSSEDFQEEEQGLMTPEGAYKKLYETVFGPEGCRYETTYNAKGNFYAILDEIDVENGEVAKRARHTVVYDRVSKNGKCQLFVAYWTYYKEDGSEITTVIDNTYAVIISTGEVVASGKKRWEDIGTEEYREAAGEY